MKKIIAVLAVVLALSLCLSSCIKNDNKTDTDTTNNEGMITDTGTNTDIVDRARSMIDDFRQDVMNDK